MSDDNTIDLYKLEYETAAERYENIYKAVWANFSYLTVVSGGIYAFGSRLFSWEWTTVMAVLPLVFWWLAIFEPMNRYGYDVETRLSDIERILNAAYEGELIDRLQRSPPAAMPKEFTGYGLRHYTTFVERRLGRLTLGGLFRGLVYHPRTKYWVRLLLPGLFAVALLFAAGLIRPTFLSKANTVIIDQPDKLDGRIAGMDMQALKDAADKDPKIKEDLEKFEKSLSDISNDVRALNHR